MNLIAERMQRFVDNFYPYYDLPLPIGSDEIIQKLQMWLNDPQCGHKEGQKFPIFKASARMQDFFYEITIKASPPIWTN